MTPSQLLETGSKLIGLYVLATALPLLLSAAVGLVVPGTLEQAGGLSIKIYVAISVLGLIIYALIGWVLIRKVGIVTQYAFGENDGVVQAPSKDFFTVGVKLLGAFTAMTELLRFVRFLSNATMMWSLLREHETMVGWIGIATNFLPSFILVLAGSWLFFRGELLANWAFAERNSSDDAVADS